MSRAHIVTTIRKNAREHLRLAWDQYEGHAYLDLRLWYEDGSDLKPSPKGVTIRPNQLADLIAGLRSAEMMGRELKLLSPEEV